MDGASPEFLASIARLALRSDSALRDIHRANNWVLEIESQDQMGKLQAIREAWLEQQPKEPGPNPLGNLDHVCWTLVCKVCLDA